VRVKGKLSTMVIPVCYSLQTLIIVLLPGKLCHDWMKNGGRHGFLAQ